jgi:dihydroorotase
MKILFAGARVIDSASGRDESADVLVVDESIEGVGSGLDAKGAETVDASGLVLAPGFVDLHTHLREPGREDAETIETGSRAAAMGGYTAVCSMPNTDPVADNAAVIMEVRNLADKAGLVDVSPAGAITKGLEGEAISEIGEMAELGVRLFTDDHNCVQSARVMRTALEYAKAFDVVLSQHAQEETLSEGWQMHEGYYSSLLGLRGTPGEAESIIVARDLQLAALTGGRIHFTHLSSAISVELIEQSRSQGPRVMRGGVPLPDEGSTSSPGRVRVSADVTPHHLTFTDEDLQSYDTNLRFNPPPRGAEDRQRLKEGLQTGGINAIATDHAPHAVEDKEVEFDQARPGTIGLETALGASLTALDGTLDLSGLIAAMSTNPARILGLPDHGGPIEPGRPANLVLFDPAAEWTVGERRFASKSRNSAFLGRTLKGRIVHTLLRGRFTVRDGEGAW